MNHLPTSKTSSCGDNNNNNNNNDDNITTTDEPKTKKTKMTNQQDENQDDETFNSIIETVWVHYLNFMESTVECENGGGDIDELIELLDLLEPYSIECFGDKNSSSSSSSSTTSSSSIAHIRTKKQLLPVLMSVAAYALANDAIENYLQNVETTGTTSTDNDNDPADNETITLLLLENIKKYLNMSLIMFPLNAAAWSMAANFARMTFRLNHYTNQKIVWYEKAAECAQQIRIEAIYLLEEEIEIENDNTIKEWIELLLLNQVCGVELMLVPDEVQVTTATTNTNTESKVVGTSTTLEEEEENSHDEVFENLEELNSKEVWSPSKVEGTARFMMAMLLSMGGNHQDALTQLEYFPHLTHRLHPNVWNRINNQNHNNGSSNSTLSSKTTTTNPVVYTRPDHGILPKELYEQLCNVFQPKAPYWRESDYTNRGYYSYFMDLPSKTTTTTTDPITKTTTTKFIATNLIEDIVCNHLLPLANEQLKQKQQQQQQNGQDDGTTATSTDNEMICGCEWWVHTRPIQANLGHNLHFDTDESLLEIEEKVTHPIYSAVLYLTGGENSGPTIVFDQTPDSKENAIKGWLNTPENNTCLFFPGNLLHGVLPCSSGSGAGTTTPQPDDETKKKSKEELLNVTDLWLNETKNPNESTKNRLTFMVGFWTRRVPDTMKDRTLYGPCGPLPPSTTTSQTSDEQQDNASASEGGGATTTTTHTWVDCIQQGYSTSKPAAAEEVDATAMNNDVVLTKSVVPLVVSPVWEEFRPYSEDKIPLIHMSIPHGIDHRYFVSNAPQCFYDSLFEKNESLHSDYDDDDDDDDDEDDEDNDNNEDSFNEDDEEEDEDSKE